MDGSIMDLGTTTRFWEQIQDLINDTLSTTPPLNANLNGIEFPRVQEDNETAGSGHVNSQVSESGSSSILSSINNDIMSVWGSPQANEYFHSDEEMVGYDLEVFGLRWKLENIQGIHQDEIRLLKVLVPYDNNGLPIFTKIENDIVADNKEEEEQIKQENTNSQFLTSDIFENCNSIESIPTAPLGNDSVTYEPNEPLIVKKESEIKAEIILPGPKLMEAEINTGCVVKASDSGKTNTKIDVIPPESDNSLKMKKLKSRTVKCLTSGLGSPSADSQWGKKFIAKKSFNPSMIVNKGEEGVFKNKLSNSTGHTFVCEFCKQGYGQKYKWRNHVQIHCGEITYKCDCPDCNVPYRDYRTMRKHHNDRTRKML